jgi:hypothetical protein
MFNLFKKKETTRPVFSFSEPENTACFTCDHVVNKQRPILLVTHEEEDGSWMFMCGHEDHNENNYKLVSLRNIVDIDNSINALCEMPLGCGADRETVNDKWNGYTISK